jgi:hypothetical protein
MACLQDMRDFPAHTITRIETEDDTTRIASEHGDGLLPMGVIHIKPLSAPRRSPRRACAILRVPDGNQIAMPVEALEHQLVKRGWNPAKIEYGGEQVPACPTYAYLVVAKSTQEESRSKRRQR